MVYSKVAWAVYAAVCIFYTMLFLANVMPADAYEWLEATSYALLMDIGGVLALVLCRDRDVACPREWVWGFKQYIWV